MQFCFNTKTNIDQCLVRNCRSVCDAASLPRLPHFQIFAAFARPTHPGLHAQELRLRAGLPRLLAGHGHHHLRHRHVLRREERRRNQFHLHSGRFLVHHRHHDNTRVRHPPHPFKKQMLFILTSWIPNSLLYIYSICSMVPDSIELEREKQNKKSTSFSNFKSCDR